MKKHILADILGSVFIVVRFYYFKMTSATNVYALFFV